MLRPHVHLARFTCAIRGITVATRRCDDASTLNMDSLVRHPFILILQATASEVFSWLL